MLNTTSTNCIFCKIANKQLSSDIIYEDDKCIAFLDVKPQTEGHTLLIPKIHSDDWRHTDEEILSHLSVVSKKIMTILDNRYNAKDFNIIVNNGAKAGQIVFHLHIHLIPRY